jgi:hypothetical protein
MLTATPQGQIWWAMTGSNRRHPACKAGALPAELIARDGDPYGIRTRVAAVKGRCLRPLDQWARYNFSFAALGEHLLVYRKAFKMSTAKKLKKRNWLTIARS